MHPVEVTAPRAPPLIETISLRLTAMCQSRRGRRLPWIATAFGTGVGAYFALPVEPTGMQTAIAFLLLAMALISAWARRDGHGLLPLLIACTIAGALAAQWRAERVAGPVLDFRYYGGVEGRVVHVDRSASGAVRVTLDQVRLDRTGPDRTPRRVRLSLHGEKGTAPTPGRRVMTTGHLSPPSGPAEPGGFDFQRHAWFQSIGAVGYTRVPLVASAPPAEGFGMVVERMRMWLADGLRARLDGQAGQVAAAIVVGDRSGLSDEVVSDLRASNLAHLLAISGLHMGLLVGFVFWAVRGGLALFPSIALHYPIRTWAACVALPFALFYLVLSGGSVATQRAFVMAAVMLGAIILGKRALSIRSVAIAALIILALRPESLTGPGFQMSFAATGALVLAFSTLSRHGRGSWLRGWRGALLSLFLSSLVAGLATAPFAAVHFNRIGQFGMLANLLAVPMMGFIVMPLLLIGLLFWPIGLEAVPFMVAGWGIEWIIGVAHHVAALPGAVQAVPSPGPWVLPLLGLGFAVFGAGRRLGRPTGAVITAAALLLWTSVERPVLLISDDGRLAGLLGPEGRWLNRESGASFVAENWLENDGDLTAQDAAAARQVAITKLGAPLHIIRRKSEIEATVAACAADPGWLISSFEIENPPPRCRLFDPDRLRRTGAIAAIRAGNALRIVEARAVQGQRPWVPKNE